jgi:hypothetical protein
MADATQTAGAGTGTADPPRGGFEVYPQKHRAGLPNEGEPTGEFGWRYRAGNGQITAIGGEGFTRRDDAERAALDFAGDILAVQAHSGLEVKQVEE